MEWKTTSAIVEYPAAETFMRERAEAIIAGTAPETIWLLEHPPLYTAGTSANAGDLLSPDQFPVYQTGRGGQYTYHGPGQRIGYVMLDLKQRMNGQPDVRRFVWLLEEWIIRTLAAFDVQGERREGRVGIWVVEESPVASRQSLVKSTLHEQGEARSGGQGGVPSLIKQENKIAALGIRLRKWVSFHGIAINVNPDLSHFSGIVPCGIRQHGVTSLHALGKHVTMAELDAELQRQFELLPWNQAQR